MINKIIYFEAENFKSLKSVSLNGLSRFSVFAGPNGSGKSNLFEALAFLGWVARKGFQAALDESGGIEQIQSRLGQPEPIRLAIRFELAPENEQKQGEHYAYDLKLFPLPNGEFEVEEQLESPSQYQNQQGEILSSSRVLARRERGSQRVAFEPHHGQTEWVQLSSDSSVLNMSPYTMVPATLLHGIHRFLMHPSALKQGSPPAGLAQVLKKDGSNLAVVLARHVQSRPELQEELNDWLTLWVPGFVSVDTMLDPANLRHLEFKEAPLSRSLSAHLVSDGTLQLLALLMAVESLPETGWSLIEEPENALHPKAIQELVGWMRQKSKDVHPVWLCTHDTHLINQLEPEELWLVDKKNGCTQFRSARALDFSGIDLSMSELWLSNLFGAGLP